MVVPPYPEFIEQAWLARARAVTGLAEDEPALEALRHEVRELSDLFTTERPKKGFHDYAAKPGLLTAYGLFFFPQSFCKCATALTAVMRLRDWAPAPGDGPIRILDLGSASGPCGFAAALTLAEATGRKVHLTALDHSPSALAELARLARELPELASRITVSTKTGDLRRAAELLGDEAPHDLVTVGFALNEIAVGMDDAARLAWVNSLRRLLSDTALLVILEPALKDTAQALRRLRDATLNGPFLFPYGPDIAATPCPFLAEKSPYWDHEAVDWEQPASLEFLNRKLHRDLRALKFAPLILGKSPARPVDSPETLWRLVTPADLQKAGIVFTVVGADGRFFKINLPIRGLSKSQAKDFTKNLNRGDYIRLDRENALITGQLSAPKGAFIL